MNFEEAQAMQDERARKRDAKEQLIKRCVEMARRGEQQITIARRLGISDRSVAKYLKKAGER